MPKKTRRSKAKKTKKVTRKQTKKSAKKPARKKAVKKKPVRKKAPSSRTAAGSRAVMAVKPAKPPMKIKPSPPPAIAERPVGIVTHYYNHLNVAVVKLDQGPLQVGDMIHIKGHTTDFQQRVESMQIEHESIQRGEIGQEFGMMVSDHVREHDIVYKLTG
jgi:putative protease